MCCEPQFMDISKAFGCVPHHLIIAKFKAYGMSESALVFMSSNPSNRQQLGKGLGDLLYLEKKVSHGPYWEQTF